MSTQEDECGVVPCVVLNGFNFWGLLMCMRYVVKVAYVSYVVYRECWGT